MYDDSWIKNFWRPAIAWQYVIVCVFDFVLAPILIGFYSYLTHTPIVLWIPITNQMYHTSMLAIITTSAYSRGQEKIEKIKSDAPIDSDAKIGDTK